MRRSTLFTLALLLVLPFAPPFAAPASAQELGDLSMRLDRSTDADDPDNVPDVEITPADDGFRVATGPAAVIWDSSNTASGEYTLSGTFILEEPSNHVNYYGLVFGGNDLEGAGQNYLYFLVAQNGTYIIKHRAGNETTHDIVGRTEHPAVEAFDGSPTTNALEVRVGADAIDFVINGTVVHTQPRTGMASRTDGIWGVRINHVLPNVVVRDLGVS